MVKNKGQLKGNIARALHHNALGLCLKLKKIVGIDAELMTFNAAVCHRLSPRGNENSFTREFFLVVYQDGLGVREAGMPFENLNARFFKVRSVDLLETVDLLGLSRRQP